MKKQDKIIPKLSYCIVIPFENKFDFENAIEVVAKTRKGEMQFDDSKKKWYLDGMIIDKEDYERLLDKSKSIEIVNELEKENGDYEDITW